MKIVLDNVTKKYDLDTLGIENINLTAEDCVCGVVGEAGSGKTTLLYAIGGIVDVDGGDILFDGRSMTKVPPKERDVVLVSDTRPIGGSVGQALAYGLKLRRVPRKEIKTRTAAAAEMFGFGNRMNVNVRTLGAEDCVRLGLARAAARGAKTVIVDEPYAKADKSARAGLYADIKRLAAYTRGVVFVASSDGSDAEYTGDVINVMRNGSIVRTGSFAELTEDPQTAYVASYVGETPVNILRTEEGVFAVRADGARLTDGNCEVAGADENFAALRVRENEPPFIVKNEKGVKKGDKAGFVITEKIRLTDEEADND